MTTKADLLAHVSTLVEMIEALPDDAPTPTPEPEPDTAIVVFADDEISDGAVITAEKFYVAAACPGAKSIKFTLSGGPHEGDGKHTDNNPGIGDVFSHNEAALPGHHICLIEAFRETRRVDKFDERTVRFTVLAPEDSPSPDPEPDDVYPEVEWKTTRTGGRLSVPTPRHINNIKTEKMMMAGMIAPPSSPTTQTVKDGDWSDPSVWSNGVPGDNGPVVHPVVLVSHNLTCSHRSTVEHHTVFVEGSLLVEDGTELTVDTLFASGRLQFGHKHRPGRNIEITFKEVEAPGKSMRLGMVTWGEFYIYGAPTEQDVNNLDRSIVFRGPATGTRAHTKHMWSDVGERWYARFINMGRTEIDETLGTGLNVLGRYAIHNHRNGYSLCHNPIITWGCVADNDNEISGRLYVDHDCRCVANDNIFIGATATGMHSELGTEIGIWARNIVMKVRGTSKDFGDVETQVGQAGAYGVGYQHQSRAIRMVGNYAKDCTIAYEWRQYRVPRRGGTGSMVGFAPDHTALDVFDPLTSGVGANNQSFWPDMHDLYHHSQVQIPQFDGNSCDDCEVGFSVQHRNELDHGDQLPLVARGNRLSANQPFRIRSYSFAYIFIDTELEGDGKNVAIYLGTKLYGITFSRLKVRNCTHVIESREINHMGHLIDVDADCPLQKIVPVNSDVPAAQHGQNGLMGPMEDYGPGEIIARRFKNIRSANLPEVPNKGLHLTVVRNKIEKGVRGTFAIEGEVVDSLGSRPYPYALFYDSRGKTPPQPKPRWSSAILGEKVVERSGAYKRDGKWYSPLTFAVADRVTGEEYSATVEAELVGFTDAELSRPEILLTDMAA